MMSKPATNCDPGRYFDGSPRSFLQDPANPTAVRNGLYRSDQDIRDRIACKIMFLAQNKGDPTTDKVIAQLLDIIDFIDGV